MPIMTGSFPKGLGPGGGGGDDSPPKAATASPKDIPNAGSTKDESKDYSREFLAGQEKGYSPRKGMAAGIVKC